MIMQVQPKTKFTSVQEARRFYEVRRTLRLPHVLAAVVVNAEEAFPRAPRTPTPAEPKCKENTK